jgi:MFS family permease
VKLSLFGSRQFDAINVTTVLFYGALSAVGYLVVLECELQLHYSATRAGAALIPYSIVFLAVSPVSGALVARFGPRWFMTVGILTVAAGFVWLSSVDAGSSYAGGVLPGVLLWGLGIGLSVTPLTAAVLAAVRDDDLGEASAINDASSRIGGVVAIAVVPLLLGAGGGHSFAASLTNGYQPAMLVLTGSCVLAALVTAVLVSDERATAPRLAPTAPLHGCALPVPDRSAA